MDRPKRCAVLLRGYDLDFDQIALSPHKSHEEKIKLLVVLRHTWFSPDRQDVFYEDISTAQIEAEIQIFRDEIERGLPLETPGFRDRIEGQLPATCGKLIDERQRRLNLWTDRFRVETIQ